MTQYPIAVIVGSLCRDSFNRKLASAILKLAPPQSSFKQAQIGDLPLYNQDDDANQAESVKRLKAGMGYLTRRQHRCRQQEISARLDGSLCRMGEEALDLMQQGAVVRFLNLSRKRSSQRRLGKP